MRAYLPELIGGAAAAASLYAAYSKTIIPLRVAAIVANVLAMMYCYARGLSHLRAQCAPAPFECLAAVRDGEVDPRHRRGDQGRHERRLAAALYATPAFQDGRLVMERGEYATGAFYIVSGEVEVVELSETFGKGTLLGEIGLFTPDGRRPMTVRCKTDVQTAMIDYDQFKELYFQNPQFGFRLLHLIVARLQSSPRASLDRGAVLIREHGLEISREEKKYRIGARRLGLFTSG